MKVLIAVHHFPPTFSGGAEWRAFRTARGLQQAGHQVSVVCVDSIDRGDGRTLQHADTTYKGVAVNRLSFNLSKSLDPFLWSYRNPLFGQHIRDRLERFQPDVFHLIGGYLISGSAIEAAQAAEVPVVLTLTDFWFLCPRINLMRSDESLCTTPAEPLACTLCLRKERRRYRLADQWTGGGAGRALSMIWQKRRDDLLAALHERKTYLLSLLDTIDMVISPSQFLKELFEAQGVCPQRFLYMRQGLDLSHWAQAESTRSNSHLRIGYIGQIAKHKGVDILVEAFQRLRRGRAVARLLLYGDTEQFPAFVERLRARAANSEDIVFAGRFEHSQVRQVHADIDVLVVPSVWYENSPNVVLEAFATGTPVVVSQLGGMAELVTDGVNGFKFEAGNSKSLASVLQRFVDRPDLVETLRQGTPPVKTVEEEIEALLEVYTALGAEEIG